MNFFVQIGPQILRILKGARVSARLFQKKFPLTRVKGRLTQRWDCNIGGIQMGEAAKKTKIFYEILKNPCFGRSPQIYENLEIRFHFNEEGS